VPTHLKLLRGNPGRHPIRPEPEPEISAEIPDPPVYLTGYAADEWWTIAPQLHRLGLLTTVDLTMFAAYCDAYMQWRLASEAMARMRVNDPVMSGLIIKTKNGEAEHNPLVSIARKAAGDMLRYASEFGLTPCARTRISQGPNGDAQKSKFDGLLAG
jgi:P27 family predicted phage terminase small subunit